jgi:nitrogen PTS system EIIA component
MMRLTESDIAACLDLPVSTINRWIRQGRIPVQKKGEAYLFEPRVLERWAGTHGIQLRLSDAAPRESRSKAPAPCDFSRETLCDAMHQGGVIYDPAGEDSESLLEDVVAGIAGFPEDLKPNLLERLIQRERLSSTGIGKGVAIPHPRNPAMEALDRALITTCFLKHPIDFNSIDGQPVFVLFIMLSPSVKQHLHLLSRLSFSLRDDRFLDCLKTRPDPQTLFARISEIEAAMDTVKTLQPN